MISVKNNIRKRLKKVKKSLCNSLNSTNKTNINKTKKAGGSESLKKVDKKTLK